MSERSVNGNVGSFITVLSRPSRFAALTLLVWLATCAHLLHSYWYATAITFPDIDDAMRLVQWRDFLNGQGWFDLHQTRLSPPQGYDPHWSRLIDAGLAGSYFLFRIFADEPMAERLMRAVWPLLWILPAIAGAIAIAWRLAGVQAALAALLLTLAGGRAYQQFFPGTIDHHNVQIALTLLAVASTVWSDRAIWCASAAGFLTALSVTIGLETLPYLAVCGMAFALRFIVSHSAVSRDVVASDAAKALLSYALAMMAGLAVLFFATIGPDRWLQVHCDALALNMVAALLPAAALLAIGGFANPSRMAARAGFVILAAAAAFVVTLSIEPRCLLGPYALIDPRMWPLWLSSVFENQPLAKIIAFNPFRVMPMLIFPVVCLGAAIVLLRRDLLRRDFAMLTACAVFLTAWLTVCLAIRATPYAIWLGIPVMAAAVTMLFRPVRTFGAWRQLIPVLLLSPFVLGSAVTLALPASAFSRMSSGGEPSRFCRLSANVGELAALPPGLIATDVFHGAHILALTPHSVLAAPFHRDLQGTIVAHNILAAPPDQARDVARLAGVTYIALCGPRPPDGLSEDERKQGLWAHLEAGSVPDWLDPVASTIGQAFTVYRVLP